MDKLCALVFTIGAAKINPVTFTHCSIDLSEE